MDKTLFGTLIGQPEGKTLDFKLAPYNFSGDKEIEDAKFVKDVLSFSNTARNETAYIIVGIKETSGSLELVGIEHFPDDSILQQKVMDKILPRPVFSSYQFPYKGKKFGIIEFPVHAYERPLVSIKPLKAVEVDTVYLRRGSANSKALASDIMAILDWFSSLRLSNDSKNLLRKESGLLLEALSDATVPLSRTLSRLLGFAKATGNVEVIEFCSNELTRYQPKKDNPEKFGFRVVKVPATPYDITIPNQSSTAEALVKYMSDRSEFTEIEFFFHYPVLEIEEMLENLKSGKSLLQLQFPYKMLFPDIESTVEKATIFFSYSIIKNLYGSIRNFAIKAILDAEI